MTVNASNLSALFYGRMKQTKTTATQIALATGLSRQTVAKYLDAPETASLKTLLTVADFIGLRRRELFGKIEQL